MKIFAHRGFSGRYPQNTMLAFQKALESGCDGIELDVQLTKDGEVVIIHDEYLDDLTDFTGNVRDYTLGELKSCNAGGKWQEVYGFQPIPTFEEYCEWASGNSLITNVEIKSSVYYYEELEKKTMELIERFGFGEHGGVVGGVYDRVAPFVIDDECGGKAIVAKSATALPADGLGDTALVGAVDDFV